MKELCKKSCDCLSNPCAVLAAVTFFSMAALALALASEVFGGLKPCVLCLYQRIPFVVVTFAGLAGLSFRKNQNLAPRLVLLCALAFLVNTGIALYHSGVERHWWKSALEGCAVNFDLADPQGTLQNILNTAAARCDQIAWADPVLGLTMANYNALLCFGLFIVCALSLLRLSRGQEPQ